MGVGESIFHNRVSPPSDIAYDPFRPQCLLFCACVCVFISTEVSASQIALPLAGNTHTHSAAASIGLVCIYSFMLSRQSLISPQNFRRVSLLSRTDALRQTSTRRPAPHTGTHLLMTPRRLCQELFIMFQYLGRS